MGRRRDHGQCPAEVLLHLRRLGAFLKQHGLHHTGNTLEMEAGVFFQAGHLLELVSQGRWGPAHRYLRSFSALWGDDDGAATRQYTALLDVLAHNSKLAWFACRGDEGGRAASLRKPPFHLFREYPETAEREAMYCSMTSQQARESVDWNDIKHRTLEKAKELLQLRPNLELLPSNRLPRHMPMPQDIVPLGFRGCRKHPRKRVGHNDDLPILCERHTTSKLSAYEDLQTITSMGFRGEALASMTYVGHVTVTTITEGQLHGYRVSYRDGVMENDPKPCAAVKGTQVMVENLFYNMVARRKTLQNSNDDYPKIVDFISRFAVHHINVNFSCRKHGANRADVHSASTSSRIDAIRNVYGASVVRDLMEIEVSDENAVDEIFRMDGFISNANYVAKKTTMILFINDRLVDCTSLKRAIEFVYSAILPQASKPFIYMSINLPPEHVDVNIHPTKKEVSLLNQERIIEMIKDAIEEKLMNCNTTRIFQTQAVNTSALTQASTQKEKGTEVNTPTGAKSQKIPSQMVRTDPRDPSGRLHTYWHGQSSNLEKKSDLVSVRNVVRSRRNPKDAGDLSSRHELLTEIDTNLHSGLLDIVKNCTYVGVADEVFALIQHNTRLYLVNVVNVSKELMYQQALCRFGNFNAIQLSEPAPLRELMMMALKDDESISDENDKEKLEIAEVNTEILKENAEMINEYFSIHIDQSGNLTRLPVVLDQYTPDMDRLPEFALTLGNDVTWDVERDCFRTAAAAIGNFYALHPPILPNPSGNDIQLYKKNKDCMASGERDNDSTNTDEDEIDQELLAEAEAAWAQREWTIQHVLFPSMRLFLKPPKSMATDGTFVQVASLEKLYKIFERC